MATAGPPAPPAAALLRCSRESPPFLAASPAPPAPVPLGAPLPPPLLPERDRRASRLSERLPDFSTASPSLRLPLRLRLRLLRRSLPRERERERDPRRRFCIGLREPSPRRPRDLREASESEPDPDPEPDSDTAPDSELDDDEESRRERLRDPRGMAAEGAPVQFGRDCNSAFPCVTALLELRPHLKPTQTRHNNT